MKKRLRRSAQAVAGAGVLAGALLAGCAGSAPGVTPTAPAAAQVADPASRAAMRDRAIEILTGAALGPDALLRANAIEGLQSAPARVERLVRAGLGDENLGVRFVSAMTVGELGLKGSVAYVQPLVRDVSPVVRAAAIYALRANGQNADPTPIASLLQSQASTQRAQAAFILGALGDPSAIALLKSAARRSSPLSSPIEDRLARLQIAEALVKLGDTGAIETVRAALFPSRPEDLEATALAVQIIGRVGDRRSIDQLVYMTAREGADRLPAEVRLESAIALAKLGNRRGWFIGEEYWQNPNPAIRAQAAFVFGATEGANNLDRLAALMEDASPMVQVSAAAATLRAFGGGAKTANVDISN